MFWKSIRRKIVGIAIGLIVLMLVTAALSIVMARTVGPLLDELTTKSIRAYSDLARVNVRSLECSLRRMLIAKMQTPPDEAGYQEHLRVF